MDGSAVPFIHLVKLINAADPLISQHQRSALQHLPLHMYASRGGPVQVRTYAVALLK